MLLLRRWNVQTRKQNFLIWNLFDAVCAKRTQKPKCGAPRLQPTLQRRVISARTKELQFQLMYCGDLISFNESEVNEWHDDVERLSLAVRTHSGGIKLLVARSHRPAGSRHNKNTSLLRLSGQLGQLPASAGLLRLLSQIGSELRSSWWDSLPCLVTDKRLTIIVFFVLMLLSAKRFSFLCLSVWELLSEWVLINILRASILCSFCTINLLSRFVLSYSLHGHALVTTYMKTRSAILRGSPR
jgi:hypothetical protein